MRKILVIGAYERDNFGDLLFFLILKEFFKEEYVVPSSIIFSDMLYLMDEIVYPYDTLLKEYEWDLIIVAGGEIGGVDLHSALNMSLSTNEYELIEKTNHEIINFCYEYLTGFKVNRVAYLPDLKIYSKNRNCPLFINSVGISRLKLMENSLNYKESFEILQNACFLSVRDNISFEYLNSVNIDSILIPDIVHSIKKVMDHIIEEKILFNDINCEYILFQCSQNYIEENSLDIVIQTLEQLIKKYNKKIYLFAAGTARHHDSFELYEEIVNRIDDVYKSKILIIYERNPLSLVKYIKYSKMWIGTSLHGRIIAITYSIPRVSLENNKVAKYSSLWDNEFPYNVKLKDLVNLSEIGFNIDIKKLNETALYLENKVYKNLIDNFRTVRG